MNQCLVVAKKDRLIENRRETGKLSYPQVSDGYSTQPGKGTGKKTREGAIKEKQTKERAAYGRSHCRKGLKTTRQL